MDRVALIKSLGCGRLHSFSGPVTYRAGRGTAQAAPARQRRQVLGHGGRAQPGGTLAERRRTRAARARSSLTVKGKPSRRDARGWLRLSGAAASGLRIVRVQSKLPSLLEFTASTGNLFGRTPYGPVPGGSTGRCDHENRRTVAADEEHAEVAPANARGAGSPPAVIGNGPICDSLARAISVAGVRPQKAHRTVIGPASRASTFASTQPRREREDDATERSGSSPDAL